MRREGGILIINDPEKGEQSFPTFTCCHCMRLGIVGKDDGGWCFKCSRLICKQQKCYDECNPFKKRIDET